MQSPRQYIRDVQQCTDGCDIVAVVYTSQHTTEPTDVVYAHTCMNTLQNKLVRNMRLLESNAIIAVWRSKGPSPDSMLGDQHGNIWCSIVVRSAPTALLSC